MTINGTDTTTSAQYGESPFSEALASQEAAPEPLGFLPWAEALNPFAEAPTMDVAGHSEADAIAAEAFESLRDESFDEALAELVAETSGVVGERFEGGAPEFGAQRARLAGVHLAPLQLEAERYVDSLAEGLLGTDVEALSEAQLDALLEGFDPSAPDLSPASEQFLGSLIKKAKGVVKGVVNTAKKVASTVGKVAGSLLGPVLQKLRGLIRPLLQRVLSYAIGRLPAPLQGPARALASRFRFEAEAEGEAFEGLSPSVASGPEALAEQFDAALAEMIATAGEAETPESFAAEAEAELPESHELENLASARAELVSALASAQEGEDVAPAVENFVPALLAALRLGLRLVGRQRVVSFLAGYLGKLIRPWVGPQLTGPLSNAIVDTGLKLITLEAEEPIRVATAGPTALASTIEDTVRRLAEAEDYVFENEDLLQLAAADAFEEAVATNFPARFVKPRLQQAPSLGGVFVTVNAGSLHPYRRYNRAPEIEVTEQLARSLRTFGGATVADALRAGAVPFPLRARLHVFEAVAGTTLPAIVASDARLRRLGLGTGLAQLHPLTPDAAGLLVREPRLGVAVPQAFLASRGRVAAGQRFYWLEPVGAALPGRAVGGPSQARVVVDLPRGEVRVNVFVAEADAQGVAAAVRAGRGVPEFLRLVTRTFAGVRFAAGDRGVVIRRESPDSEELAAGLLRRLAPSVVAALREHVQAWFMTAVSTWARTRLEEFMRAAAARDQGVTLRVVLSGVPGLTLLRSALAGRLASGDLASVASGTAFRGTPSAAVSVLPGRRLR